MFKEKGTWPEVDLVIETIIPGTLVLEERLGSPLRKVPAVPEVSLHDPCRPNSAQAWVALNPQASVPRPGRGSDGELRDTRDRACDKAPHLPGTLVPGSPWLGSSHSCLPPQGPSSSNPTGRAPEASEAMGAM